MSSPKRFVYQIDAKRIVKVFVNEKTNFDQEVAILQNKDLKDFLPSLHHSYFVLQEDGQHYASIEMEMVSPLTRTQARTNKEKVTALINKLHEKGFSHGDARWNNIARRGNDFIFLDAESVHSIKDEKDKAFDHDTFETSIDE